MQWRKISEISAAVGLFHVLIPLIGIIVGLYVKLFVGSIVMKVDSLLLIGLGLFIVFHSFSKRDDEKYLNPIAWMANSLMSLVANI